MTAEETRITNRRLLKWPVATLAIMAINVLVFAIMVATGAGVENPDTDVLLRWGADYAPKTTHGEWWRLVTSGFVHIGMLHMGMNMIALWLVGRSIETRLGRAGFLIVYLLSGIAGALLSTAFSPDVVSAGASGSVMGMYGALLGFMLRNSKVLEGETQKGLQGQVINVIGYTMLYGLRRQGIDNAAHLGGALSGFLMGVILSYPVAAPDWIRQARINKVVAGIGAALCVASAFAIPRSKDTLGELGAIDSQMQAAGKLYDSLFDKAGGKMTTSMADEKTVSQKVIPAMKASIQKLETLQLPEAMESARKETLASWRPVLNNIIYADATMKLYLATEAYNAQIKGRKISDKELNRFIESEMVDQLRSVESMTDGLTLEDAAMTKNARNTHIAAGELRISMQLFIEANKATSGAERTRLMKLSDEHKKAFEVADQLVSD